MTEEMKREIERSAIEKAMTDLNRESIKDKGHPFVVAVRTDGEMVYRKYDALTVEEIANLRRQGIIL